jgi:hypothetical protein
VVFPTTVVFGHVEDVLALAFVLLAIRSLSSERWTAGALLLAVAISFKQWAFLGVPLVIAVVPSQVRLRALRDCLVLPATLVAIPLAADWAHASRALFAPQSWTSLGHAALWVHRSPQPVVATRLRLGAMLVAILIAFLIRDRREPTVILAGLALAFMARLLFEEVIFAYYLSPLLAVLFLHERVRGGSGARTVVLGSAWLAFFLLHPNTVLWWGLSMLLAAGLCHPAVAEVWRVARDRRGTITAPAAAETTLELHTLHT